MTLLQIIKHLFLSLQMTPPYFIQIRVLSTCTVCLLKNSARCTFWSKLWNVTFNPQKTAVMTISMYRNDDPFLLFNNIHLSETDTRKHLGLLFHDSLSWHTHIIHLHQKVMTKINHLCSFFNLVPRHALLTIYRVSIKSCTHFKM